MIDLVLSAVAVFQSTLPYGSDHSVKIRLPRATVISIHAPLRERQNTDKAPSFPFFISIHAPLRERPAWTFTSTTQTDFNPRSLTGATACSFLQVTTRGNFNPRSLTGATKLNGEAGKIKYISIHAPLRERHVYVAPNSLRLGISIHAPLRERQGEVVKWNKFTEISIHAPLRERPRLYPAFVFGGYFNPRSLTGAT